MSVIASQNSGTFVRHIV